MNLKPQFRFLPEILILLLALLLRLWAVGFGLPGLFHADEPIIVNHALRFGTGDFNPHFFNIPPLTSYLLFGIYGALFIIGKILGYWPDAAHFAGYFFQNPAIFYLLGRVALGVIPAVLSVYLLMAWMRKRLVPQVWVLAAGALFAVCFVHVSDAHYIYADMPLILVCLIFFKALHSLDLSRANNHVKLGLLIGLAAAFKYNGIFLFVPYLWMSFRAAENQFQTCVHSLCAAFAAAAAFFILNPYALIDLHFFINELKEQSAANQGVSFWHHLTYSLAQGISWPLVVLGLAGCLRAFFSKDVRAQSISLFCLVYYFVLWQKGQPYGRYILPLVPFLIFLAADAAQFLARQNRELKIIVLGLVIGAGLINTAKDIRFDLIMRRPDTRTQAAQWIEANISSGSRIAMDGTFFTPRLSFSCEQLKDKLSHKKADDAANRQRIQFYLHACKDKPAYNLYFMTETRGKDTFLFAEPEISSSLAGLKQAGINYVVIVSHNHADSHGLDPIKQAGKLVRVWDPYGGKNEGSLRFDEQIITGGPFTGKDLFFRRFNGYRIELYQLDADA